jgi:hypothetical protein
MNKKSVGELLRACSAILALAILAYGCEREPPPPEVNWKTVAIVGSLVALFIGIAIGSKARRDAGK